MHIGHRLPDPRHDGRRAHAAGGSDEQQIGGIVSIVAVGSSEALQQRSGRQIVRAVEGKARDADDLERTGRKRGQAGGRAAQA